MLGIRDIWIYANNIISTARQILNENLKSFGLGSAEGNILVHLFTYDYPLRQEDLVEGLEISKPAVSRALNSLEMKGFVQRRKDPDDKRASRIFLTEKAFLIGPELEQVYEELFQIAAQGVTPEDIEKFISFFKLISESLARVRDEKKKGG